MRTCSGHVPVFLTAIFAVFFACGTIATASPVQGGPVGFYLMNKEQLGLSPAQISSLQKLNMKFQKLKTTEDARIKLIHREGMQLLMQKEINTAELKKDIARVLKHKKNIMTARIEMLAEAHKILTDDQFSKVKKLLQQMMMHQGMHPTAGHPSVAH
ncbi:MAG: hypothetical protein M0Z37_06450 [Nitrospiraceae bacterium]|jgi:hypothetical protein|nr:hypothetical protein [Nitrospiraceae bacterium]